MSAVTSACVKHSFYSHCMAKAKKQSFGCKTVISAESPLRKFTTGAISHNSTCQKIVDFPVRPVTCAVQPAEQSAPSTDSSKSCSSCDSCINLQVHPVAWSGRGLDTCPPCQTWSLEQGPGTARNEFKHTNP